MLHRRKTVFLNTLICVFALFQVSSSLSLTEDRPPDPQTVTELGKDVALSWGFSYKDSASISNGPWEAPDVLEISFGIWKSVDCDRILLIKKLVAVDKNGNFTVHSGYESKMDWNFSINKLTFTLKSFALKDQATYGINVEFGVNKKSLIDTVFVQIGASYSGQDENLIVRNETAYVSETVDLLFRRSTHDQKENFSKYRIYKENVTIITLGKEQDGKNGSCVNDSVLLRQCQQRFSLRYVNKTHVSFRLTNVTQLDSGRYLCQAFFLGITHDPEYDEINFSVAEKPSVQGTTTQAHETSDPKAKGGQSDIQFSATFLLALMIFQTLFQIGMVMC